MLRAKARWELPQKVEPAATEWSEPLQLPPLVARLLTVRGYADAESARRFLYGNEDHFHDPFLLDGMETAVERIRQAIRDGEKIRIYGDYDADGVSATSLMIGLLGELGAVFDYVIPHRQKEGYGLNGPAVEAAARDGVGLIVTVDTGISAVEEARLAKSLGVDLIVTDHHEPPETLPETVATLNPLKPGCPYPFKQLAGVGVAFKLAHALLGRLPEAYMWLAAIGTIADLMPLTEENRLIAGMGIRQMRESPAPGLRALCEVAGLDSGSLTSGYIGFSIGPRINAGGRLETADAAVACLTAADEGEALVLAREMDRLNRERQQLVDEITREALDEVESLLAAGDPGRVLVVAGEGWNPGVVGIVASRVLERHYRPTIILSTDRETGLAKGSARSIPGFDLYAALTECADLLEQYGGHKAAAGMTLKTERIADLRQRLNGLAESWLEEDDYVPVLAPDAEIRPEEITVETIRQLALLEPYGMGNPQPVFLLTGMQVKAARRMGRDGKHAKLALSCDGSGKPEIEALLFGKAELTDHISATATLDLVGELSINEWNGMRKPQVIVKDVRVPEKQVFDWRERALTDPSVADWLSGKGAEEPAGALRGALLFRETDARRMPAAMSGTGAGREAALWLADERGQLRPLNARAETLPPHLVGHLMLPVLPTGAEAVRAALGAFPSVERIYAVLHDPHPFLSAASADREGFKRVYATLLRSGREAQPVRGLAARLAKVTGLTTDTIRFILAVFEQLGFLAADGERLVMVEDPAKKALDEAPLYREKASRDEAERLFLFSTAMELKRFLLDGASPESATYPANA